MKAAVHLTTDTIVETLRLTQVWSEAPAEVLQEAARRVDVRQFEDGDLLIRQGEPGEAIHVVVQGEVEVRVTTEDGNEVVLASLGEGQSIGEMSLLTGEPASAHVVAKGVAATLALPAADFTQVVASNPQVLRQVVRVLSDRLSQTDVAVGLARGKEQDLTRFLREGDEWDKELIGNSAEVRKLRKRLDALAEGRQPVLVRGEEGTSRALVARLIHNRSERRASLVIGVDCATIVETPWGDQLFSAPGARAAHGRALCYMELAEGGTLVLKNLERLPAAAQHRLARHLAEGNERYDVRVVATCPESDVSERGRVADELLACFEDRVLDVPPLRERKRDVLLLAEHYREKHAARLNKEVRSFADPASTRLVSYEYRIANDRELEEAVERAVILTEGEEIEAETIFLGHPPPPRRGAVNLFRLPGLDARKMMRWLPRALRVAAVLFFAFILVYAFVGPRGEEGSLATTLVWSLWWPVLVLSFFFAGRAWCAVCPMGLANSLGDRLGRTKRRIPSWLKKHDAKIAMAGLFLIVFVEETTAMRHSPVATGLLLLAILVGAVVTGLLLPRRSWCRHICPLGGLAGVCATSGLLELRPTADICAAKCKGHACYKGDEHTSGCPMFNHVMFVDSNQHCAMCMNCVLTCPNDSPQLNVRMPGREIWAGSTGTPGLGQFVLMLLGLLGAMVWIQYLERAANPWMVGDHRAWFVGGILFVGAALPLLIAWPMWRAAERRGPESADSFWNHVAAFVPLVTAGLVAYQLEYLPGLGWLRATFHATGAGTLETGLSISLLSVVRVAVVAAGMLVTGVILWRAHHRTSSTGARGAAILATTVGYGALLLALMLKG